MVCSGRILCKDEGCETCFNKSFASHEKAQFWSDKNELKPREVFKSTSKKYWFDCDCGHEIYMQLCNVNNGAWCRYCAGMYLCNKIECEDCFNKSFASHEKSKFWSIENKSKPRQVFKSSGIKYWFNCDCGHEFNAKLNWISSSDSWCPYCSSKILCDDDDCEDCFDKSFASHEKAQFWSEKNKLKPRQVFKSGSSNKFWFNCDCGHEFQSITASISNGRWCPYCAVPSRLLCDKIECDVCLNRSFATHEKSKFWSEKNKPKPRQVFKHSNNKFWFDCDCGHQFRIMLNNIIIFQNWCPYCSNPPQQLCDKDECENCHNKSFASHDKSKFWSDKNKLKPRQVFKNTNKKIWFNCDDCGHEFNGALNNITSNNSWCPVCKNKTEKKLLQHLKTIHETVQHQFKPNWCRNIDTNRHLPFDFVIKKFRIIIELDGEQHFSQVSNWQAPEETQKKDLYKMKCANENGYTVIRLLQDDVYNDKGNWEEELDVALNTKYEEPTRVFIGNEEKYGCYEETKEEADNVVIADTE